MEQLLRRITAVAHDATGHGNRGRDLADSLFALVDEFDEAIDLDAQDAADGAGQPAPAGAVRGLFVRLVSRHGMNDNAVRRTLRRAGVADALTADPALTIADDGLTATAIYQLDDADEAAVDRLMGRRDRLTGEFSGIQYAVEFAPVGQPAPPAGAHTPAPAPAPVPAGPPAAGEGMTLECVFRRAAGQPFAREDLFTVIGAAEDHLSEHLPDLAVRSYEQVDDELHVRMWTSAADDRSRQIAAMWGPADTDIDGVGVVNGNCVQVI